MWLVFPELKGCACTDVLHAITAKPKAYADNYFSEHIPLIQDVAEKKLAFSPSFNAKVDDDFNGYDAYLDAITSYYG